MNLRDPILKLPWPEFLKAVALLSGFFFMSVLLILMLLVPQ